MSEKSVGDTLQAERYGLSQRRVLELPANVKLFDKTQEDFFKQLDNWDSIPDEILQRYIYTLAERAVIMENLIITDYQKNAYHLSLLRENLAVFSKNKKENKAFIAETKEEIAKVKALDKTLAKVKARARLLTNKIVDISKLDISNARKQLTIAQNAYTTLNEITENEDLELDLDSFAKAKKDNLTYYKEIAKPTEPPSDPTIGNPTSTTTPPTTNPTPETAASATTTIIPMAAPSAKPYAKYKPEADVMLFPPTTPCSFVRLGADEFSGEKVAQLKSEMLFQYTNDFLKQYIKDKAHITGHTSISRLGNLTFLNLDIVIQEADTKIGFGALAQNAQVTLKFVNGTTIILYNQKSDSGTKDATNTFTTFKGQFLLDKNALSAISAKELDKLRVSWSTGFEDYPIYNVDVLMRQLSCIDNKN